MSQMSKMIQHDANNGMDRVSEYVCVCIYITRSQKFDVAHFKYTVPYQTFFNLVAVLSDVLVSTTAERQKSRFVTVFCFVVLSFYFVILPTLLLTIIYF
jgi:hypothetical protein